MTTQQQIDIEFDSLARENDSPKLIANSKATGGTLLSVIKDQLSTCGSFDFCVAFVADGGLQILVETFQELKQRGIRAGCSRPPISTSTHPMPFASCWNTTT
jgi:HKD family nuclease